MRSATFRKYALEMPDSEESSHMNHPDFRVGGKIFATLCEDGTWGMVKLTSEQQTHFCTSLPEVFAPASGRWGEAGATIVQIALLDRDIAKVALEMAWRNTASKKILEKHS